MNFLEALMETKRGNKIVRACWNGEQLIYHNPKTNNVFNILRAAKHGIRMKECFLIKKANGNLFIWYPMPGDLVANDYRVVGMASMNLLKNKIVRSLIN